MSQSIRRIVLASRPVGPPKPANFRLEAVPMPEVPNDHVLLETIYLSLDPYMRGRMSDAKSYVDPIAIDDVMVGATVSRIKQSRNLNWKEGDIVVGSSGWQTHAISDGSDLRGIDPHAAPMSTGLGVLGMTGFSAYAGLRNIGRPKPRETVVVAAASGAVGSVVGQLARIDGARIGIAGGGLRNVRSSKTNWALTPRSIIVIQTSRNSSPRPAQTGSMSISKTSAAPSGMRSCHFSTILGGCHSAGRSPTTMTKRWGRHPLTGFLLP